MDRAPVVYFSQKSVPTWLHSSRFCENIYCYQGDIPSGRGTLLIDADGVGIIGGRFVWNKTSADKALDPHRSLDQQVKIASQMRGSIVLYLANRSDQRISILGDPLGQRFIYIHKDTRGFAASSSLRSMLEFLTLLGTKLKKNLRYSGAVSVATTGGYSPSSWENIFTMN